MHADFPFVEASHLEAGALRSLRRERVASFITLLATVGIAWYWWTAFAEALPGLSLAIFALSLSPILLTLGNGVALAKAPPELLGRYTKEGLERLLREVCASYGELEIPALYVVDSKEAVATVRNVDGVDFFRPWNAVSVGSYFLHSLDEDELKAVLAHEMCHFSLRYTGVQRYFYLWLLGRAVWTTTLLGFPLLWLTDTLGTGWSFWLTVVAFCALGGVKLVGVASTLVFVPVAIAGAGSDSRQIEALCDLEGARRFGLGPMINALLKTGTRSEIFYSLHAALSPDPMRPIGWTNPGSAGSSVKKEEKRQLRVQERALRAATKKLEKVLPPGFVSLEEAQPFLEEALKAGDEVAGSKRFRHRVESALRWLSYDVRIRDSRLDSREIQGLLGDLRGQPERPLMNLPKEVDPEIAAKSAHPTIRNRILFLAHNLTVEDTAGRSS